jgi:hypothetical protein
LSKPAGKLDDLQASTHFPPGILEGLPVFRGNEDGDVIDPADQQFSKVEEDLRSSRQRRTPPLREGLSGGRDCRVHYVDGGKVDVRLDLAGCWIEDIAVALGPNACRTTTDPMGDALHE